MEDSDGAAIVVWGIPVWIIEGFGELWPLGAVAVAFVIIIVVCVLSLKVIKVLIFDENEHNSPMIVLNLWDFSTF